MSPLKVPHRRAGVAVLALCAFAGCANTQPPPSPASFNRPAAVAFACLDLGTPGTGASPIPVHRGCCAFTDPQRTLWYGVPPPPEDACPVGPADTGNFVLHALVTQTASGEVAAVDLRDETVEDSRRDIPGYTFVPVGELPTAIAVGHAPPHHTYVASAGSADIHVLATGALRQLSPGQRALGQAAPLELGARPLDMVVQAGPFGDRLFVTLPAQGQLLVVPIRDNGTLHEEDIQVIALSSAIPAAQVAGGGPYAFHHAGGSVQGAPCERYSLRPLSEAPLEPPDLDVYTGGTPEPGRLTIDAYCPPDAPQCTPRLLVSDLSLPIVHVFSLDGNVVEQAPIVTGVPTSQVVVTPWVPTAPPGTELPDGAPSATQFIYAIDATDGSVLATEQGKLLRVSNDPNGRPDRLPVEMTYAGGPAVATTLEVVHPGFDPARGDPEQYIARTDPLDSEAGQAECFPADSDGQDPRVLRGVFLAVGLADGTVQIVDVHDTELSECSSCPIALRRHAPRIDAGYRALDLDPEDVPNAIGRQVLTTPTFTFDGQVLRMRSDGTTFDSRIGGLSCIRCGADSGKTRAYPAEEDLAQPGAQPDAQGGAMADAQDGTVGDDSTLRSCALDEALICAEPDPWTAADEAWAVVYEGVLPGSLGGEGRFGSDAELDVEIDPCAVGALGEDALSPDHPGDQLVLRSPLPPDSYWEQLPARARAACEALAEARAADPALRVAFPILGARRTDTGGTLALGSSFVDAIPETRGSDLDDLSLMEACFVGEPVAYDIRVREGYLVSGSRTGFVHRVGADGDGRCILDPGADPRAGGRAWAGRRFENHGVSFQLATRPPEGSNVLLSFRVDDLATKAVFDGTNARLQRIEGVLPTTLRYNALDERLYLVDIHRRGLLPISLGPLPLSLDSTSDYD